MAAELCIFLHQQICRDFSTNRHHLQVYSLRHRRARRDPYPGRPTESTDYWKWLFQRANHGAYSNPGTQLMA